MCGICGLYDFASGEPVDEGVLRRMMAVLRHRGPDDEGTYVSPTCPALGLGHTRLSIIDLVGGHQPLANEDGSVWVILNGEIYNYRELRADLEARGHRFRTETDTETIVHLYEESGTGCLAELRRRMLTKYICMFSLKEMTFSDIFIHGLIQYEHMFRLI